MKKKKFVDNNQQYNNEYYDPNYSNQQPYYDDQQQYYDNQEPYYDNQQQYYNNNNYGYNSYYNKNEQKGSPLKKYFIIGGVVVLFIIFIVILMNMSSSKSSSKKDTQKDTQPTYKDDTKRIGNSTFGYLTVPGEWVPLTSGAGSNVIQYSDKDNDYVISLAIRYNSTVDDFVPRFKEQFHELGYSLTQDIINKDNTNMYQLYGRNSSGTKAVLALCFQGENDIVHYILMEGPDIQSPYFNSIPYSFSYTP